MAVKEKIRIRLKGYDHQLVDQSAEKIVETAKRTGARVSGPVPLPTEKEIVTILRAVHKYKDSREQFEMRTHKRLIDILRPSNKTVEALMGLELPAGVEIEIKLEKMDRALRPWSCWLFKIIKESTNNRNRRKVTCKSVSLAKSLA